MRRIPLWLFAITLGWFAFVGILEHIDVRGWGVLVLWLGSCAAAGFVVACVLTAMESVFPSLRLQPQRVRRP